MQSRGKNIKIYDKIKLKHSVTQFRLHSQQRQFKSGSYNQAVGCHKSIDQTDWFVVLKSYGDQINNSTLSYHFQYGDKIILSNSSAKKYLHATNQYESQTSHNHEVSLCDSGDGNPNCPEDQWIITKASSTQDNYWRVGQQIILQSVFLQAPLSSHRRKMRQTGQNQVFVPNTQKQAQNKNKKQKQEANTNNTEISKKNSLWVVSQIQPFIYSSNLSEKKIVKLTEEAAQINRLKEMKKQMKKKQPINIQTTSQLLKFGNQRIRQIEDQRKKVEEEEKKKSCWKKYFCCCCPSNNDEYAYLL